MSCTVLRWTPGVDEVFCSTYILGRTVQGTDAAGHIGGNQAPSLSLFVEQVREQPCQKRAKGAGVLTPNAELWCQLSWELLAMPASL